MGNATRPFYSRAWNFTTGGQEAWAGRAEQTHAMPSSGCATDATKPKAHGSHGANDDALGID